MDPVREFLEFSSGIKKEAAEDLKGVQNKEFLLWKTWKDNGKKPEHLRPLLNSLRPFINSHANKWTTTRDVPPAAVRAEFMHHAVQALDTYDPSYGAQINTHVGNYLKKAQRFVTTYQNPARIPETRIYKTGAYKNALKVLEESYGRTPTHQEMADYLKWPVKQVETLHSEIRVALPQSRFAHDPGVVVRSREAEVLRLLPYELTPDEKLVFEHIYGIGGKPQLTPGQISAQLGISAPKVSRLKQSIAAKYKKYVP